MIKDDLLNLLPDFFKNILEYPEIMKAWGDALQTGENNIQAVMNNLFVQTCDETTLEYWESLCGLHALPEMSLNDRRAAVINSFSVNQRITRKGLFIVREELIREKYNINVTHGPGWTIWTGYRTDPLVSYFYHYPPRLDSFSLPYPYRYPVRQFMQMWTKMAPAHVSVRDVYPHLTFKEESSVHVGGACSTRLHYTCGG